MSSIDMREVPEYKRVMYEPNQTIGLRKHGENYEKCVLGCYIQHLTGIGSSIKVLDLACGNGHAANYFSLHHIDTVAIDVLLKLPV